MRAISTRSYTNQANQAEIPSWEDMELKPVLARQMEAYAAFLDFADHHSGRLIDGLHDHLNDPEHIYQVAMIKQ
jgi:arylsulfatase A-like enzyme